MTLRITSPLSAGALVWALALAVPAVAQQETGMSGLPYATFTAPRADFYEVGTTTRGGLQTEPFSATMPAPPAGAHVERMVAVWNYHLDGPAPAFDVININGNPVVGNLVGQGTPDLDWGKDRSVTFLADDVTAFINVGASNTFGSATDKPLGSDPRAFGAGMSIIVVHKQDHGTEQRVSLWAGFAGTESSTTGEARVELDLAQPYLGGPAHFFLNGLDGESFRHDEFRINNISAGGQVAGTVDANNAWQGLKGPAATDDLYDGADDDIKAFMTAGDLQLRARTIPVIPGVYEQFAHSLAVLTTLEDCGSWLGYCTAQVNSLGCTPVLDALGTPSAGANPGQFGLRVSNLMNNMNGLFFYGYGEAAVPFQGGTLCVAPPVWRTGVQNSGGSPSGQDCTGQMIFDFNAYAQLGLDPGLVVGATIFGQYWTRDVGDSFGSNLSSAICFDLCQ